MSQENLKENLKESSQNKSQNRRSFIKNSLLATLATASVLSGNTFSKTSNAISSSTNERILANRTRDLLPRDFSGLLLEPPLGFSRKTLENHLGLYRKYVKTFNSVNRTLETEENIGHDNLIKKGFSYAGVILHELYFHNLTSEQKSLNRNSLLEAYLKRSFKSVDSFLSQFIKAGISSRGWAVLGLNLFTTDLEIYILDAHNEGASLLYLWPVLVLDMYEHAYLIDHGTNKRAYANNFVERIDWSVLERRFEQGIAILEKRDLFV